MIEERLTRLERANRRLTLTLLLVGLAGALVLTSCGGPNTGVPSEIKAHMFTLVDNNGTTRAVLGIGKLDDASLTLFGENGKVRAYLDVNKAGWGLTLLDDNDKPRADLVCFSGERGGPQLSMTDSHGNTRATLSVSKLRDGPYLGLDDENGKVLGRLP